MKKKFLILFSIIAIEVVLIIFIYASLRKENVTETFETAQINIIEDIQDEQLNNIIEETIVEITEEDTSNTEAKTTNSSNAVVDSNKKTNSSNAITTKDEVKPNTKNDTITNSNNTPSSSTSTNITSNTVKPTENTTSTKNETVTNARPELAYSTYRVTNTNIVPEIIKILNNEISKSTDLVSFGCKAIKGNKTTAYNKTTGFTYLFVKDINKGKVSGNYTTFEQRVRNTVGAFANYNVYAEDEYTYDGQGLNPKWCQTLVWIYLTF